MLLALSSAFWVTLLLVRLPVFVSVLVVLLLVTLPVSELALLLVVLVTVTPVS